MFETRVVVNCKLLNLICHLPGLFSVTIKCNSQPLSQRCVEVAMCCPNCTLQHGQSIELASVCITNSYDIKWQCTAQL